MLYDRDRLIGARERRHPGRRAADRAAASLVAGLPQFGTTHSPENLPGSAGGSLLRVPL